MNFRPHLKYLLAFVAIISLFGAEVRQTIKPLEPFYVNVLGYHYDAERDMWVTDHRVYDNWMVGLSPQEFDKATQQPPFLPGKQYHFEINLKKALKPKLLYAQAILMAGSVRSFNRRLVLVNVEQGDENQSYRYHAHLGLLYVGTVAKQEGWDVVLWDELAQGHCDLAKLVKPGDVVGLSLIVTGMHRGIALAEQAKQLGANCVIAGNDSAIFRANQILRLPGKPIDAVFNSNSLSTQRAFFRSYDGHNLSQLTISDMQTEPGEVVRSNSRSQLLVELQERKRATSAGSFDLEDVFIIPDFSLFPEDYWNYTWQNYRTKYGHKYPPELRDTTRNAIVLLAQGCTRTGGSDACTYCTIAGIGDIRIPSTQYLTKTMEAYQVRRITSFYNATDSALEMTPLVAKLEEIGAHFPSLQIYGRAQGLALYPKLIDRWLGLVGHRLMVNVGMDSGDDRILSQGVIKSSLTKGSRLEENRQAVHNIKATGAHLHYSLIFGSPGETEDSCKRTVEFAEWSVATLGDQLDLVETDLYWLNFGSPASRVFTDYAYAQQLASLANKEISFEAWQRDFAQYADTLVVPWSCEQAWYEHFTHISLETAEEYNQKVRGYMETIPGSITGVAFNPIGIRKL